MSALWRPAPSLALTAAVAAALVASALTAARPAGAQGVDNAAHARWADVTNVSGLVTAPATKWGGALIADLDGDGWYDLVLNNHDQTNLMLYWNTRNGTFARGADPLPGPAPQPAFAAGRDPLPFLIDAHGLTAGDIFLTGSSDFIVMQGGANGGAPATPRLLRSSGRSRVLEQAQRATMLEDDTGGRGRTPLLVDMDRDGDLDLILLNYVVGAGAPGPRQRVYENHDGVFVRRNDSGLENANVERAILTDLNGDGRLDVVAFPFLRIFIATGNFTFEDRTVEWMRLVPNRGRVGTNVWAAAELDADNDGRWDVYLAKNQDQDAVLLNVDNEHFRLAPFTSFAADSRGHGDVTVGDFNNDGATDVFLSYAVPAPPMGATPAGPRPAVAREDVLLTNGGAANFTLTVSHGANQVSPAAGDSVQAFDYNLDGRLDLLIGAGDEVFGRGPLGTWSLFANTIYLPAVGGNHWLIASVGRSPNGRAAGTNAVLSLTAALPNGQEELSLLRRVGGAGGSGTSGDLRLVHFGLGRRTQVVRLTVRWSDGSAVTRTDVPVDTVYTVTAV
eukprot:TRINITY_DN909_c0_g1_i3.p1 TRINITY_DN909_c0_g1~~TRINITY_DN909_c0_g1_i3.p1  ORF type:complete len:561 (+),score=233.48 TRINITY_DN909_c0_g1_i3:289-1971(+)